MRAIRDGAYDFFTKPVDIGIVRTVINRAIENMSCRENLKPSRLKILKAYSEMKS